MIPATRASARSQMKTPSPSPRARVPAPSGSIVAFRLLVEYEGTKFNGWQRQGVFVEKTGVRTVAGSLERALRDGGFEPVELMGAGRTDAGVHALGQVAHLHFSAAGAPDVGRLARLFDEKLPSDLAIRKVEPCPPNFHARHDAHSRTYLYQLSLRRTGLAKPFVWWVRDAIDVDSLNAAWKSFEGFHEMASFADLEKKDESRCRIDRTELATAGRILLLRVTASHFLKRQVRRMIGSAVAVATGQARLEELSRDLAIPSEVANKRWSKQTAPASGLILERVRYAGEADDPTREGIVRVP